MLAMVWAGPAEAKRRRKASPKATEPLDVVVLPFSVLRGNDAKAAREALELELELVDNIRVQDGGAIAADLDAARDAFDPAAIKAAMGRRSIEVLITAPPGFERPLIVVYGADGKPRLLKELPRGAGPDQMAATALAVVKPALGTWSTLKPQKLPPRAGKGVDVGDVVLGDDDDDGDVPSRGRDPDDEPRTTKKPRRTATLDDDADDAETKRRGAVDGDGDTLDGGPRRSLSEIEDKGSSAIGPIKTGHLLAVSGTFDGAAWHYNFEGNDNVQPGAVGAGFHPGGSIRADLWPVENFGIDASAALSTVQFQINSNANLTVAPNRFVSIHANAGVSGRGRYLLHLSDDGVLRVVGIGGRIGYRFWQGTVETQRITSSNRILTVVPGFTMHALTVGPELYIPLFMLDRRFEVELKLDTMPVTRYAETPDNPGKNSLAFGYHAELLTRFDLYGGFFVELAGKSTGATINFEGEGDRVTVGGNETDLVTLKGGRSLNVAAGFSVGVGFMY
jgi:hypothetical protein